MTPIERRMLAAMDAEDARAQMSELRRKRIQLDAVAAKHRHWKKIKSKRFHRILNKKKRQQ